MALPVRAYADLVRDALGPAVPNLAEFLAAADDLDAGATSAAEWADKVATWDRARRRLSENPARFLLAGLPEIPGLDELAGDVDWADAQGLHGSVDIGPLHLELASAALVVMPPPATGLTEPVIVGPFQPSSIRAAIRPPFGGGSGALPGGGDIIRLTLGAGFGGRLQLPLGPVSVECTAILERQGDGTPSFLAVMGAVFTPPIQLSFGFSLDRVGGIVGVNRRMDTDALTLAVRTGAAGNALFATSPPASAAGLVADLRRFFPDATGTHVVGPTLRLSWLSLGSAGSFVSLDLGVVLELPSAKVAVLGVARAGIPSVPGIITIRVDVVGVFDPGAQLVSIDGSLVDSGLLGIFSIYGDAALRVSWGSQAYTVLSIGGFYPGFNPEPARLPAMRRVGMAATTGFPGLTIRVEGYLAATSNTIQLGGRFEISFELGLEAHGFLQVDALIQFSPFHFEAACSAGFDVGVAGFSFGGVRLDGIISGPGPVTIRGRLTIETFLFDISWDETFTLGGGPADNSPRVESLLAALAPELTKAGNLRAESVDDPDVVLRPRPAPPGIAAVPPTGALRWAQRRAPLGFLLDRVDAQPLSRPQGVKVTTPGAPHREEFAPGSFCNLTDSEALGRPPFDVLQAGIVISPPAAPTADPTPDHRKVELIVIRPEQPWLGLVSFFVDLHHAVGLIEASNRPPALSDAAPLISAHREVWTVADSAGRAFASATEAHQQARFEGTVALSATDAARPVDLVGV